ncbi:serine/threonine protein kinase [Urbifossiella limnaea]|uniref:Serine/threonine-protein kinase StkP n=1 Tax=Urbifossiella limnaea TaxID=2528023 RepID=A0A517XZQ4_9BACT|nr:serine/threonine-protein kinase [Urbifossiella limnaea]QDU22986.1 Serine/threonine-protein kinase StkP [Urbifossiella limnaea]
MIGGRVGNWFVEAQIGDGPGGPVYAARGYDDPARRAAVKVFPAATDPAFLDRFAGELLALQRLDHPNIARTFDSGTHAGRAYVASELAPGTDLARQLETGRLTWREVLAVAVEAARALKHGHNRNLLHRDLKPAHLVRAPDGTVRLVGYGLAKVFPPPLDPGRPLGSASYLPPETAGGKPPTRRSDLYALGGVLYTLLTGRPPFAAATLVELTHKHCYALPERPRMLAPDVPLELDEFVCTLLAKEPTRRPASAGAVLDELERIRGKLERQGEAVTFPPKLKPDTAEAPALPASLGGIDPDPEAPRPKLRWVWLWPIPAVLVAVALGYSLWPRGDDFDDDAVRDVVAAGVKPVVRSDAERGFRRGLALAEAGEAEAARRAWLAVTAGFGGVESEAKWVGLAKAGLAALERRGPGARPDRRAFDAALARAKELPPAERTAALDALAELVRDDPAALEAVRAAR